MQITTTRLFLGLAFGLVTLSACQCGAPVQADGGAPDGGTALACNLDDECPGDQICRAGECQMPLLPTDGGQGDGDGDGDGDPDGGQMPGGVLTVLPSALVEFGAQRIGVPVERTVQLVNSGDAPLSIIQLFVDQSDSEEFSATPVGAVNVELQPSEVMAVTVVHTPVDGSADSAELRVVHDGAGPSPVTIDLFAEFKGESLLSLTTNPAVLTPDVVTLDLGSVPLGAEQTVTVFVRNDGSGDSALTLSSVSLTPASAGFGVEHPPVAEGILSSFIGFCPAGIEQCPAESASCTDGVCLDVDGVPPDTFPVTVTFTADAVGEATATLTLAHDASGLTTQTDVTLVARGVTGQLLATPGVVAFPDAFIGRVYEQIVTVENVGVTDAHVQSAGLMGGVQFELETDAVFPLDLAPTASFDVTVRFAPVVEGGVADVFSVVSDQEEDLLVELTADARLEPEIVVDDSLAFGGVYGGTTRALSLPVRNAGPGVLHVGSLSLTGPGAARYSVSPPSFADPLDPLADPDDDAPNLIVEVTYAPELPPLGLVDVAELRIVSDDPDLPEVVIDLSGESIQPTIVVTPTQLDFGAVGVGASGLPQTIEVHKTGYGDLVVSAVTLPANSPFTLAVDQALPATVTVGGAPLSITVGFVPEAEGTEIASLTILSNDVMGSPASVALVGAGVMGELSASPAAITFADAFVGRDHEVPVVITNVSEAPIQVTGFSLEAGTVFSLESSAPPPFALGPGEDVGLVVHFVPDAVGTTTDTLHVTSDVDAALTLAVTGTARDEPTVLVEPALDLGEVYVDTARSLPVRIRNLGPGALTVESLELLGPGSGSFSISPTGFAAPLSPLADPDDTAPAHIVNVTFGPDAVTGVADQATLRVGTDDPDTPSVDVALSGLAVEPRITVTPGQVAFGQRKVGEPAPPQVVTIQNAGFGALVIESVTLPGGSPFSITPSTSLPASLTLGGPGLTLTAGYTPGTEGPHAANVLIASNDESQPVAVLVLAGEGVRGDLVATPPNLAFGDVFAGRQESLVVTVENVGEADVELTGASMDVGNAAVAVPLSMLPTTVAVGATVDVRVDLTAGAAGAVFDTLRLVSDLPDDLTVAVSATARDEPTIVVAAALGFGAVYAGTSRALPVSIRNLGPGALTVGSLSVAGPDAARYSLNPTGFASPLAPLAQPSDPTPNLTVTVTYSPLDPPSTTTDTATLEIASDDPDQPVASISLSGLSVKPVSQLSDTVVDFGSSDVGSPSAPFVMTIHNIGFGDLVVSSLSLPGGAPFSAQPSSTLPAVVPAGGAPLSVTLRFTPSAVGAAAATLSVVTGDQAESPQAVQLTGQGVQGAITATPAPVAFGDSFVGMSYQQVVTLQNSGAGSVTVDALTLTTGAPFDVIPQVTLPITLGAAQSFDAIVTYDPTAVGTFNDSITVESDLPSDPVLGVSGIAREPPEVLVNTTLSFGAVYTGSSQALPLSIRNLGPGPLTISDLDVSGPSASRFSLSPSSFPDPLDPLADPMDATPAHVLQVTYTPGPAPASDSATLSITTDDPVTPVVDVTLSGSSIQPVISLSTTSVNFGEHDVGVPAPTSTVTVSNVGVGDLVVTSLTLPGGSPFVATPGAGLPAVIPPAGPPLQIDLGFTAPAAGPFNAQLTVHSSDQANPSATVSLAGSGATCPTLPGASFVQSGANCTYSCLDDFWDLNGDLQGPTSDGCEYSCVLQNPVDLPDEDFTDDNCDGIDGDLDEAVFVSTAGSDANPGTREAPMRTLSAAISTASAAGADVYAAGGVYTRSTALYLSNGVSLYGGYDASDWSRSLVDVVTIDVNSYSAVRALSISSETVLDLLDIRCADNTTGSTYALFVRDSDGLVVRRTSVTAGTGFDGQNGVDYFGSAPDGEDGTMGQPGCEDSSGFCASCSQPQGGVGGFSVCGGHGGNGGGANRSSNSGYDGNTGLGASGGLLGYGTDPGLGDWNPGIWEIGLTGGSGVDGAMGAAGYGTFISTGYGRYRGADGVDGSDASGGGGGGGGGGGTSNCDSYGGGGGGGGGGGCGGYGGGGGYSGGGSFAVFLWNSDVELDGCTLTTMGGGDGGWGGYGENGGSGGTGASRGASSSKPNAGNFYGQSGEQDDGSNGGKGGNGGTGGEGGNGGGGAGGPSVGVLIGGGSAPTLTGMMYSIGPAGSGGDAGFGGNDGPPGVQLSTYTP